MIRGFTSFTLSLLGVTFLFLLGCGETERQSEQTTAASDADLVLTPERHPHGYGKKECFQCHIPQNIHQKDGFNPDKTSLARTLTEESGILSCKGCHGTNGVPLE